MNRSGTASLAPAPRVSVAAMGLADAVAELTSVEAHLEPRGWTVVDELVGGMEPVPGEHYPVGDVWDQTTHAQYFYHAHPEGGRDAREAGHFHVFLGQAGMPPGASPLVLPEMALAPLPLPVKEKGGDPGTHRSRRDRGVFSHIIGISVDAAGRPIQLFTTNRWVTGETWYRAEDVVRMLDRFALVDGSPTQLVDRWLVAVLRVMRPRIAELIDLRDKAIMDWRRRRSRQVHVFDDRRLEVVSACDVDFPAVLAAIGGRS
jgi:hypothetical protein